MGIISLTRKQLLIFTKRLNLKKYKLFKFETRSRPNHKKPNPIL